MQKAWFLTFLVGISLPTLVSAQNFRAPGQIAQLSCSALTVQSVGDFRNRFGFPSKEWSSMAEDALSRKIDECFPANMKSSSKQNDELQSARQQAHLAEMQAADSAKVEAEAEAKQIEAMDPQVEMLGEQLFVEKHCPMLTPDHDMFASVIQKSGSTQLIDPDQMSDQERQKGQPFLQVLETKTDESRGFKAGSPMDIRYKCSMAANAFVNVLHLYTMKR